MNIDNYIVKSLELHLFFGRIMKEHSFFLKAGFTPADPSFIARAEFFKTEFERLLSRAVSLSNGIVSKEALNSGEIVTEFTYLAEKQTEKLTGISINKDITNRELRLSGIGLSQPEGKLRQVRILNQTALKLLNGLISLKEDILSRVLNCQMFTVNYPLLIKHILREAKLYRQYIQILEIPFNTGEAEKTTFVFTAQKAVARFMPALDNESYEGLENMTYGQWWNKRNKSADNGGGSGNGSRFGCVIDLCGANIGAGALKDLLNNVPFVHSIDLSGANIYDDSGEERSDSAETVEAEIIEPEVEKDKPFMEMADDAMKASYEALTEQIDVAPEGSPQRIAMQEVLESLKSQINSSSNQFESSEEQA